jgi:orotidine-5'-phosphate decarboxylase
MAGLAHERLIVALDVSGLQEARAVVAELGDAVSHYKVGPYLFETGLISFIEDDLIGEGKKVFLDFKSVDIGDTMRRMSARAANLRVEFITVMGMTGTIAAAAAGREGRLIPNILAVTLLTDHDKHDMQQEYNTPDDMTVEDFVCKRALIAAAAGADGVICSPREVAAVSRAMRGRPNFLIVTPGVRPIGSQSDDQNRTSTPSQAIEAGADYLVIGRPIIKPPYGSRRDAAYRILDEMQAAMDHSFARQRFPLPQRRARANLPSAVVR